MPIGKWIPFKLHEFKRLLHDMRIDAQLGSERGRQKFWEGLKDECARDSMCGLLESALGLSGDVIECGVYRGDSLLRIARTVGEFAPQKTVLALDSFQGFPEEKVEACDVGPLRTLSGVKRKFRFCADTPTRLERIFQTYGVQGQLVRGYFSDTLPKVTQRRFCFIHLDVDLYASYKECLDALYDRLTPGGVIVFDEYNYDAWPGSTRAINEYFSGRAESVQTCTDREQHSFFIRKAGDIATRAA